MTPEFATSVSMGVFAFVLMAAIAIVCAVVIKLIVYVLARSTKPKVAVQAPLPVSAAAAAATQAPTVRAEDPDELAVLIAAACQAVVGAHRIVYLAENNRPANWTTEMRTRQHLSHLPHR
jgi:hypothetical protein